MDGLESSPGWGWVTSAPKIIVGRSLTRGIRREIASTSTVFLPPTFTFILRDTLAKYCLLILNTCLVKQHCETMPRSVSQIRFRSPRKKKYFSCSIVQEFAKKHHMNFKLLARTIKGAIIVGQYDNQQIELPPIWLQFCHSIMKSGFQDPLNLIRASTHWW